MNEHAGDRADERSGSTVSIAGVCPFLREALEWAVIANRLGGLKLRAAVDAQRVTADPAGLVGGEKYDSSGNIIWLGDTFQRLYSQREVATGIGPREV